MITFHDIDEIETGDMIGYKKTESIRSGEVDVMRKVTENSPLHMQARMKQLIEEYHTQVAVEARFIKAIDKFEPLIHLYNDSGKRLLNELKTTVGDSRSIKEPYIKFFPVMDAYFHVLHKKMERENYFLE